ncbi:hypothetical protein AN958_00053 [Leucoagaricus sp. SymC.cos]|nr:hypothetical protein AN958_00053 [Leucoagaricus sp. SymC.cos]
MKNLNIPKNRARKLCLKFIRPYKVIESYPDTSNYKLDLSQALVNCRIHLVFHVSLLRPFNESDNILFPD